MDEVQRNDTVLFKAVGLKDDVAWGKSLAKLTTLALTQLTDNPITVTYLTAAAMPYVPKVFVNHVSDLMSSNQHPSSVR